MDLGTGTTTYLSVRVDPTFSHDGIHGIGGLRHQLQVHRVGRDTKEAVHRQEQDDGGVYIVLPQTHGECDHERAGDDGAALSKLHLKAVFPGQGAQSKTADQT